jgi:hypothetical protein
VKVSVRVVLIFHPHPHTNIAIDHWSSHQLLLFNGIVNNLASLSHDNETTLHSMWTIIDDEWNAKKG